MTLPPKAMGECHVLIVLTPFELLLGLVASVTIRGKVELMLQRITFFQPKPLYSPKRTPPNTEQTRHYA